MSFAQNFTTTRRATEGVRLTGVPTFSYIGTGINAHHHMLIHGARVDARSFHLYGRRIDGVLSGDMLLTRMLNTVGEWYSLRSIKGNKRCVYLRADALVVVEGVTLTLGDFYGKVRR